MKKKIQFSFIGGDNRQKQAIFLLAQEEFQIHSFGLKDVIHENIQKHETLDRELFDCHVLMLPIPYNNARGSINIADPKVDVLLETLMQNLKPGTVVIYGKQDKAFSEVSAKYPVSCYDILKEESFSVLNAIPTAEGAIQLAMERTDITLHKANVLILGYGRIGKVLSRMLRGIGSRVAVEARKNEDRAWIEETGCKAVSLEELDSILGSQDVIFNTVPAMMLDRSRLARLDPRCVIIDLASHPGGVDFEAARDFGILAGHDLSLPGIVAPRSAARIICQVTREILKRHFQQDVMGG
jgi:dipicolinate synthase subunit A